MQGRQSQQAGENSQQVQVHGDYHVHQGLTEERATEIARTTARAVLAEYGEEASAVGADRVEKLVEQLIPKLHEKDLLGIFRDPSFHIVMRKAQASAASSERESDYDMLASLLADRAERGQDRTVRASVDRAVQVVDLLDDRALNGLTVFQAFVQYAPIAGSISVGLDVLERLISQLINGPLPEGPQWIDHLDTLGVIRESGGLISKHPAVEVWAKTMPGYVSQGISPEDAPLLAERQRVAMPLLSAGLVDHELKPGWKRFPAVSVQTYGEVLRSSGVLSEPDVESALEFLRDVLHVETRDHSLDEQFAEEISARPHLKLVSEWWDRVPT